ncbi:plasmid mobilization relaxosome protein MobC [Prevotella intermedia]|uniref:Plasmid mobilization relaxosome protein MobC n=1 Tax=Prevotella intermedia TaxID=28131 RepID=A0AAJ3VEC0_PREIN|nr:plasmid mobilization relaxosome protein MobC [Prevotella intermedia]ATV54556.1 plasmid mobilization relaxosome protein MobC [Prevotella intermedia]PJI20457.1 plasmid mobilization relaxosome protein MobC [Prevotella intermedia]
MTKSEYNKGGRPTKGAAEKKKYCITVKLNTQDYYTLKGKAKSAGISMSEFVRKVLDKGNVIERLTIEQADFIRKLCGMANNLNQLTHRANAEGFHVIALFHKTIIGKIDEILNLIRR